MVTINKMEAIALKIAALKNVLIDTAKAFSEDKVSQRGAALAFFTVFALPPLLVLLVIFLSFVLDDVNVQQRILSEVQKAGGKNTASVIGTIFENANQPQQSNFFAVTVSLSMLAFSATNLFAQLQDTLNTIWGVRVKPGIGIKALIKSRLLSFSLILALGALVILMVLLDVGLAILQKTLAAQLGWLEQVHFYKYLSQTLSFAIFIAVVASIFKILPDVRVAWKDVFVGAVITALMLSLSKIGISYYLSHSHMGSAYGAAGSTILFLFWAYLNIQIFLIGAEITEVYAHRFGSAIQPTSYAVWLPGKAPEANEAQLEVAIDAMQG